MTLRPYKRPPGVPPAERAYGSELVAGNLYRDICITRAFFVLLMTVD